MAGRDDIPSETMNGLLEEMNNSLKNMQAGNGQEPMHYKGKEFMPGFSAECIEYVMGDWAMPQNSVIVSSYPKTGTAWCIEIVRQILFGHDEAVLNKSRSIPMPFHLLELGSKKKFDILPHLPTPRNFFATHISADLFNFDKVRESKSKVIYVYRNPKDQAVSWYHFANKIPHMTTEQKAKLLGKDWNEFFAKYIAGEHPTGLAKGEWYPDHVIGWMEHVKSNNDVLPVEYESMKKDFPKEVLRIAKFLEVELSDDDVKRVTERCTVSAMKNEATTEKSGFLKMNVRKGEVGGWKEQLTVSQSELIDNVMKEKLSGKGINFTYVL